MCTLLKVKHQIPFHFDYQKTQAESGAGSSVGGGEWKEQYEIVEKGVYSADIFYDGNDGQVTN